MSYGLGVYHPQWGEMTYNAQPLNPFYMVELKGLVGASTTRDVSIPDKGNGGDVVVVLGRARANVDKTVNFGGGDSNYYISNMYMVNKTTLRVVFSFRGNVYNIGVPSSVFLTFFNRRT